MSPLISLRGVEFIIHATTHHQGAIKIFSLHFRVIQPYIQSACVPVFQIMRHSSVWSLFSHFSVSSWPESISDTSRLCCCQSVNETSQRGLRSHRLTPSPHHPPPGSAVSTPLITPPHHHHPLLACVSETMWEIDKSCVCQEKYEKVAAADWTSICVLVCVHICGWVPGVLRVGIRVCRGVPRLSGPRYVSCYLFLILPALCGFPAVTGLRVETGTNEQLHPACLPGIMGLQADRASVCAPSLHSHFVICSFPCFHLISAFRPFQWFNYLFLIFHCPWTKTHSSFL